MERCPCSTEWVTTTSRVVKFEYTWTIANILNYPYGQHIVGPTICAEGRSNVQWTLKMIQDHDGYLCLESRSNSPTEAAVSACIYDANNTQIGYTDAPYTFQPQPAVTVNGVSTRRSRLIKHDDFLRDPGRYLSDDKLSVRCTLRYLQSGTCVQLKEPVIVVPPPEKGPLMENMLAEGQFSDVILEADEREFRAHRVILAGHSDVFRAMFQSDTKEQRTSRVVIEDLSADAVSDLLTFIYTDTAPNADKLALELLEAAEKYNIVRLKAVCEAELAKHLDIDNVIDRLIVADTYRADQLKEAALHCITKHASDIVTTEHWETLCKEHPGLVKIICERFASHIKHLKTAVHNTQVPNV